MKYDNLNESNKVESATVADGYTGRVTAVSYHMTEQGIYVKAACGCWRENDRCYLPKKKALGTRH